MTCAQGGERFLFRNRFLFSLDGFVAFFLLRVDLIQRRFEAVEKSEQALRRFLLQNTRKVIILKSFDIEISRHGN